MNLKEMDINARNRIDSTQNKNYCRALIEYSNKHPGSISHGVT